MGIFDFLNPNKGKSENIFENSYNKKNDPNSLTNNTPKYYKEMLWAMSAGCIKKDEARKRIETLEKLIPLLIIEEKKLQKLTNYWKSKNAFSKDEVVEKNLRAFQFALASMQTTIFQAKQAKKEHEKVLTW